MSELKEILESFCKIEGVNGAFLIDREGNPIEKTVKDGVNIEMLEPLMFQGTKFGIEVASKLQKDKLTQSYLEFEDMSLTSIVLENESILTILSASGMNLGRIRLEIRKNKKRIEGLLS